MSSLEKAVFRLEEAGVSAATQVFSNALGVGDFDWSDKTPNFAINFEKFLPEIWIPKLRSSSFESTIHMFRGFLAV